MVHHVENFVSLKSESVGLQHQFLNSLVKFQAVIKSAAGAASLEGFQAVIESAASAASLRTKHPRKNNKKNE